MEENMKDWAEETRAKLRCVILDWEEDMSSPANFVRKNGLGKEIARVDRWCGGYQDCHKPITIGWRAQMGNRVEEDVVLVDYSCLDRQTQSHIAIGNAIIKAKKLADDAIPELLKDLAEFDLFHQTILANTM